MEDELDKHFKKVYASSLDEEIQKIYTELEKIGLISKLNILYWSPGSSRYQIIKLKPYE